MEADVVNLGKEIERLERQAAIDAELAKATSTPITNQPHAGTGGEEKTGRATDEYRRAFWNGMRNKMSYEVQNALSIGTDSEGGYLVPDEYERTLVEALNDEVFFRNLATVIKTSSGDRKIQSSHQRVRQHGSMKEFSLQNPMTALGRQPLVLISWQP